MEFVFACRQVGVGCFSLITDEVPVFIETFQFVFVLVFSRDTVTQADIFNAEYIIFVRKFYFFYASNGLWQYTLLLNFYVLIKYLQISNDYRRYISIERDGTGIQFAETVCRAQI